MKSRPTYHSTLGCIVQFVCYSAAAILSGYMSWRGFHPISPIVNLDVAAFVLRASWVLTAFTVACTGFAATALYRLVKYGSVVKVLEELREALDRL